MSKSLRIAVYAVAGAMGVGGAALGISKGMTLLIIFVAYAAFEGVLYLARRSKEEHHG